jgi:hypothetical protein
MPTFIIDLMEVFIIRTCIGHFGRITDTHIGTILIFMILGISVIPDIMGAIMDIGMVIHIQTGMGHLPITVIMKKRSVTGTGGEEILKGNLLSGPLLNLPVNLITWLLHRDVIT